VRAVFRPEAEFTLFLPRAVRRRRRRAAAADRMSAVGVAPAPFS